MTLRQQTFLMVGTALTGLLILLLMVSSNLLLKDFSELENQSVEKDITLLVNALTEEVYNLYVQAGDYSRWDDTYQYMQNRNEQYIQSNFPENTFSDLNLNLVILLDRKGQLVFGKSYNLITATLTPLSAAYRTHFERNPVFTYNDSNQGQLGGFLLLTDSLMLIASRPILTSQEQGPSRGTLIMGRYLDKPKIKKLSRFTMLNLSIQPIDHKSQLPEDFVTAQQRLLKQRSVVQVLGDNSIAGYVLIKDVYQHPVALLRVKMTRDIYHHGLTSLWTLSGTVLALALGFSLVILGLFERLVLARLAALSDEVKHIRTTDDFLTVTVTGHDELAQLARAINEMLKALQASHIKLRHREASLAEAQRIAQVGNWDWNIFTNEFECSDETYRIFGLTSQSCTPNYEFFLTVIHPEDRHLVAAAIGKVVREYQPFRIEHRIVRQDGTERFIQTQGELLRDKNGEITHLICTLQDITEPKLAQAETLRLLEENRFLIYRSLAIQEEERRYLARELHDEFGQCITAIQADAETIVELANGTSGENQAAKICLSANAILTVSSHVYDVVHTLMRQLRPSGLDELGLIEILQDMVRTWQSRHPETRCVLTTQGELHNLGETVNITIYRILQECLTNVAKYANASQVTICLGMDSGTQLLTLDVQDNGQGMNLAQPKRGLGLIGIRERVQALNGRLLLNSTPGQGVKLTLTIPLTGEF